MNLPAVSEKLALEMAKNGVLHSHKKSKTHPKMKPFIGAIRNEIEILKPEIVLATVTRAADFIKSIIVKKGLILIVGTQPSAHAAVRKLSDTFNFPYVTTRWLGGTITNFSVMKQRLAHYQNLKTKKEKGELSKYTKKEQSIFGKELNKMKIKFDGLVRLDRVPDAVLVIDPKQHDTAVKEGIKAKIPVLAVLDTNDNPEKINFPIMANDHSKSSVDWLVEKILEIVHTEQVEEK